MDGDEGGVIGVWVTEEQVDLAAVQLGLQGAELGLQLGDHGRRIGLAVEERCQLARVGGTLPQTIPSGQLLAQPRRVLADLPGTIQQDLRPAWNELQRRLRK